MEFCRKKQIFKMVTEEKYAVGSEKGEKNIYGK